MVDLIPEEYRKALRMQRLLRGFGWTLLGVCVAVGVAVTGLSYLLNTEREALARLKQQQAQDRAQQARLAELTARRDGVQKQLQALDALRGGASIGRFAEAVDAALSDRIWFQEVAFSRATAAAEHKVEGANAPNPALAKDKQSGENFWRAQERAEVRGLAGDHAVLAEFIKQLGAQPEVRQVKLLDTSARNYPNVQVVDFQLAALLGAAEGGAR